MAVEGPDRLQVPQEQLAPTSQLFQYDVLDEKDLFEKKLEDCFDRFSSLLEQVVNKDGDEYVMLYHTMNISNDEYKNVCLAMTYSLLIDKQASNKCCGALMTLARDNMAFVISQLEILISEKFTKLLELPREQLYWVTEYMVKENIVDAKKLCFALLKQIPSGDTSKLSKRLAESMLQLFINHRQWLESHQYLLCVAVYTFLRLIPGHHSVSFNQLRKQEIDFCISLIREKFSDVQLIGRDLIRVLHSVAAIPEFYQLWVDLLSNPKSLDPNLTNIYQLLSTPTPRFIITSRITLTMDNKLRFLTHKVKLGLQFRYQEWFQIQHLSAAGSQEIIPDIIRYVCCVIHPPNDIIGSDILQRWALIGWLLNLCTTPVSSSEARLALFYDYIAYSSEKNKIMNVEPAILLMYYSIKTHTTMTASLLEFICLIIEEYFPQYRNSILQGFNCAFHDITNKKVLNSLSHLFDSPLLDHNLRKNIKSKFSDFITGSETTPTNIASSVSDINPVFDSIGVKMEVITPPEDEDAFPDPEDDCKDMIIPNPTPTPHTFTATPTPYIPHSFTATHQTFTATPTPYIPHSFTATHQTFTPTPTHNIPHSFTTTPTPTTHYSTFTATPYIPHILLNTPAPTTPHIPHILLNTPVPTTPHTSITTNTTFPIHTITPTTPISTSSTDLPSLNSPLSLQPMDDDIVQRQNEELIAIAAEAYVTEVITEVITSMDNTLDITTDIDDNNQNDSSNNSNSNNNNNNNNTTNNNNNDDDDADNDDNYNVNDVHEIETDIIPMESNTEYPFHFEKPLISETMVESPHTQLSDDGSIFEVSNLEHNLAEELCYLKKCSKLGNFSKSLEEFMRQLDYNSLDEATFSQISTYLASLIAEHIDIVKLYHNPAIYRNSENSSQLSNDDSFISNSSSPTINDDETDIQPHIVLFKIAIEELNNNNNNNNNSNSNNCRAIIRRHVELIELYGFSLLIYLIASQQDFVFYEKLFGDETENQFIRDLESGLSTNIDVFFLTVCNLYRMYQPRMVGIVEVTKIVVSSLDPNKLYKLTCYLMQNDEFSLFGQNAEAILCASLKWETFEQYCIWQLLQAESIKPAEILNVIPYLNTDDYFEALTGLLLYLKSFSPDGTILKYLLTNLPNCIGIQSLLVYWSDKDSSTVARALTSMIHQLQNEESATEQYKYPLQYIIGLQEKSNEFQDIIKNVDLVKCLLDLFDAEDELKESFKYFFTLLQQTKSTRRGKNNLPKQEIIHSKRGSDFSRGATNKMQKKKRKIND